jgi:hypothetical protein
VNVVDARTFNEKQVIRVTPPNIDQHIAGVAFTPDSKGAFVGTLTIDAFKAFKFSYLGLFTALEGTVLEYEIDTISRRSFPLGALI